MGVFFGGQCLVVAVYRKTNPFEGDLKNTPRNTFRDWHPGSGAGRPMSFLLLGFVSPCPLCVESPCWRTMFCLSGPISLSNIPKHLKFHMGQDPFCGLILHLPGLDLQVGRGFQHGQKRLAFGKATSSALGGHPRRLPHATHSWP